jgi:hypothetical protein
VRQEARRALVPQHCRSSRASSASSLGDDQQPLPLAEQLAGDAGDHLLGGAAPSW